MITLKTLVNVAPFDEETRTKILNKIDKNELDADQINSFTNLSWEMILTLFESELQIKFDQMLMEEMEGKQYSPNDFTEERLKIVYTYVDKFEKAGSPAMIEEVKKQLLKESLESNKITNPN